MIPIDQPNPQPAEQTQPADPARKPGIRLGPFIFVPELLATPGNDPWAKRKGEPRIFALLWCTFLMVSALLTIFSVRFLGSAYSDEYRSACMMMCVMGAIGICVLWPALRLCQLRPRHPARSVFLDALVIAVPLQAVIWPMPMLTDWRYPIAMSIGVALAGWSLIVGAIIAWGYLTARRILAMVAILGLALLAPIILLRDGLPPADAPAPWWALLSPLTAPWALSWSKSGWSPAMSPAEWRAIVGLVALGAAMFVMLPRIVRQRH